MLLWCWCGGGEGVRVGGEGLAGFGGESHGGSGHGGERLDGLGLREAGIVGGLHGVFVVQGWSLVVEAGNVITSRGWRHGVGMVLLRSVCAVWTWFRVIRPGALLLSGRGAKHKSKVAAELSLCSKCPSVSQASYRNVCSRFGTRSRLGCNLQWKLPLGLGGPWFGPQAWTGQSVDHHVEREPHSPGVSEASWGRNTSTRFATSFDSVRFQNCAEPWDKIWHRHEG